MVDKSESALSFFFKKWLETDEGTASQDDAILSDPRFKKYLKARLKAAYTAGAVQYLRVDLYEYEKTITSVKANDRFYCTRDVVGSDKSLMYIEGRVYTSEEDDCITDVTGDRAHGVSYGEGDGNFANQYFKKIKK